jgi:hypothetical protein
MRGDARTHSSADFRAGGGESEHGNASSEATRGASDAPAEKTHAVRTEMPMGGSSRAETPTVLAATVLRFQCVEREEKEREDELYAFQSGEARAGDTSEGLALEQLRFLLQDRNEFVRAESGVEAEKLKSVKEQELKSKPEPFTLRRVRHPREFQSCMGSLRCRAEGLATRLGFTPVPRGRICHPPKECGTRKR